MSMSKRLRLFGSKTEARFLPSFRECLKLHRLFVIRNGSQSEFSTYTKHLSKIVQRTCPKCSKKFCYACGEPVGSSKYSDQHDCLFHCPNLQGVILGVGLAMLESKFTEDLEQSASDKTRKRRQVQISTPQPLEVDVEEDDDFYPPISQTKKMKLGIGYAGDAREDVRVICPNSQLFACLQRSLDIWSAGSLGRPTGEGRKTVEALIRYSSIPTIYSSSWRWQTQ